MWEKPASIFGRDREWRGLTDFAARMGRRTQLGVVSGRRRQGKTYLLQALVQQANGIYFGATQATEAESLGLFRESLSEQLEEPVGTFGDWYAAAGFLFHRMAEVRRPVVIDEFSYLAKVSPSLPSIIQREIDASIFHEKPVALLLCGSAMSVMGGLLSGQAPLRGRASLEMIVRPFSHVEAARYWGIGDVRTAALSHAVVGGTAAYREFADGDVPADADDFDDWVCRTVLNPINPLCREARYLLNEDAELPNHALYHSILAAVALGNNTAGGISSYVGKKLVDIAHYLTVLEDCQLLRKEPDMFRKNRPRYRVAEPLVTFYNAIMRPQWGRIESGDGEAVWRNRRASFYRGVMGPHFEELCRQHAALVDYSGELPGDVGAGVVPDPSRKTQVEVDVAVLGPEDPGRPRRVLSLGECKWGEVMGNRHVARLARARELLGNVGYDVSGCALTCYSGAGFEEGLTDSPDVKAMTIEDLYRLS